MYALGSDYIRFFLIVWPSVCIGEGRAFVWV